MNNVHSHIFSTGRFRISFREEQLDGYCDGLAHSKVLSIWVASGLGVFETLETLVHECIHAEFPRAKEGTVKRAGRKTAWALIAKGCSLKARTGRTCHRVVMVDVIDKALDRSLPADRSERRINAASRNIARLLWRLGYQVELSKCKN